LFGGEVDVGFVEDQDAVPILGEELLDVGLLEEGSCGVAGRAQIGYFDMGVGLEGRGDGGDVEGEAGEEEGHGDEGDVVYLGGDAVHAVGRWAGEYLVFSWDAKGADEGVDGFV